MTPILIAATGMFLFLQTGQACADWDRDDHRGPSHEHSREHHSYPRGELQLALSDGFFSIFLGSSRFYVSEGIYYRRERQGYVVVDPPIGAVIREIPPYSRVMVINGVPYYTYNGVFYQYTPRGYMVIDQSALAPVTVMPVVQPAAAPAPVVVVQSPAPTPVISSDTSFTVNIPDAKGGYTSVIIQRSGNGFKGPQGEFYPEFPKVEQLKVMYAK